MDGPRPSSLTAPSTWKAADATPHRKSFGNTILLTHGLDLINEHGAEKAYHRRDKVQSRIATEPGDQRRGNDRREHLRQRVGDVQYAQVFPALHRGGQNLCQQSEIDRSISAKSYAEYR